MAKTAWPPLSLKRHALRERSKVCRPAILFCDAVFVGHLNGLFDGFFVGMFGAYAGNPRIPADMKKMDYVVEQTPLSRAAVLCGLVTPDGKDLLPGAQGTLRKAFLGYMKDHPQYRDKPYSAVLSIVVNDIRKKSCPR